MPPLPSTNPLFCWLRPALNEAEQGPSQEPVFAPSDDSNTFPLAPSSSFHLSLLFLPLSLSCCSDFPSQTSPFPSYFSPLLIISLTRDARFLFVGDSRLSLVLDFLIITLSGSHFPSFLPKNPFARAPLAVCAPLVAAFSEARRPNASPGFDTTLSFLPRGAWTHHPSATA